MSDHTASRRILVVSDDQDTGRFLGRVLEDAGYEVLTCPVDEIAIEMASSFPAFDAVLGDSITGVVVRRVRNLADPDRAATPIVVLAAYHAPDSDEQEARSAGATDYLTRPIMERDLVGAVAAVMPPGSEPEDAPSGNSDD